MSSKAELSQKDIDRPLNPRGKRDAPFMAAKLRAFGVKPDVIITSPANRAMTTATHFAKALDILPQNMLQESRIYEAYATTVLQIIQAQPNNYETILIFGHNPAFTMIANMFKGGDHIDNVPTCGISKIESKATTWKELSPDNGKLTEFYYPKQYF